MAELSAPLFSLHAHGKLADALTFQRSAGRNRALDYSLPTGKPSAAQVAQRARYATAAAAWAPFALSAPDAAAWALLGSSQRPWLTAYAAWIQAYLGVLATGDIWVPFGITYLQSISSSHIQWDILKGSTTVQPRIELFSRPTSGLLSSDLMNDGVGAWFWRHELLAPSTRYYSHVTYDDTIGGRSRKGILLARTTA